MPPKSRKHRPTVAIEVPPRSTGPSSPPHPGRSTRRTNLAPQPSPAQPAPARTRPNPALAAPAPATPNDDDGDDDTDSSSDAHIHNRLVVPTSPALRRTQRAETELVPETDHEGAAPATVAASSEFGHPRSDRATRASASKGRAPRRKGAAETGEGRETVQQGQAAGGEDEDKRDEDDDEDEGASPPLATRIPAAAKRAAPAAAASASAPARSSRQTRAAAVDVEEQAKRKSEESEGEPDGGEDEVDQLDEDDETHSSPPMTATTRKDKGKAPAQGPASSFFNRRKAPSQRASPAKKMKKRAAVPERDSGSEEELPDGSNEGEGAGELSADEASDEDDERPPESVFSHRAGDGSWVPDRVWLHREWQKEGKRDKVARWIKEHGGKVMKRMEDAHYAILPEWTSDSYVELYAQAFNCNALPTLYAWLLAARDDTARHGVPCRPNPLDFASPRPLSGAADRRGERYLRLSDAELDEFARLYNLCDEGEMSRAEMFSRMQREFYSELDSRRTTTSAYRDKFDLHKRAIKQRARRLREDAKRAHAHAGGGRARSRTPSAFRSPSSSPGPPSTDKGKGKRRRRSTPPAPGPAPAPDPLAALAQRYGRSRAFVDALLRACTLDGAAAERALRRLAAYERAAALDEDGEEAQREWDEVLRGVWREEDDEALREVEEEEGEVEVSDGELARRSDGRWSGREVGERRELLRVRADERWGWEETREELRRAREGKAVRDVEE
ncbi:hypothetical protein JCM3775_004947 [Rhodotorula graminis]